MIIGIGYRAASGKDTVADYLVEKYHFNKTAFASSLKEACGTIFHLNNRQLHGDLKEVVDEFWGKTPRYILQRVGTECMRHGYDEGIWIKSLERQVKNSKTGTHWVISDTRFINEAYAIKNWGGKLVKMDRPESGASGGIFKHASEIELEEFNGWDYIIHNDSTIEDLFRKVDNMMELIL